VCAGADLLPVGADQHGEGGARARVAGRVVGARGGRRRAGAAPSPLHRLPRPRPRRLRAPHHRAVQEQAACELLFSPTTHTTHAPEGTGLISSSSAYQCPLYWRTYLMDYIRRTDHISRGPSADRWML
jgi:hypothetical protein